MTIRTTGLLTKKYVEVMIVIAISTPVKKSILHLFLFFGEGRGEGGKREGRGRGEGGEREGRGRGEGGEREGRGRGYLLLESNYCYLMFPPPLIALAT